MDAISLKIGLALRKEEAHRLQTEIILACEQAAGRRWPNGHLPTDQADWDNATWERYLTEAAKMESLLGERLRRLYREISSIERLAALPLPA
jgi:hypothetical protein